MGLNSEPMLKEEPSSFKSAVRHGHLKAGVDMEGGRETGVGVLTTVTSYLLNTFSYMHSLPHSEILIRQFMKQNTFIISHLELKAFLH